MKLLSLSALSECIESSRRNTFGFSGQSFVIQSEVLKYAYNKYKPGDVNDFLQKIHLYTDVDGFLIIKNNLKS